MPDLAELWGLSLEATVCERCDGRYLLPHSRLGMACPRCVQGGLAPLPDQVEGLPVTQPPELLLPFTVSDEVLTRHLQNFAGGIWFAPADLKEKSLMARLQRIYLPMWLVDSQVQALWQAEAGFDYQVVSHQDSYQGGQWVSRQVNETRIRWEPRLGRLDRAYHNLTAPALEEHNRLRQRLGPYDLSGAQAYRPSALSQTLIRLPDRPPDDAWPDTLPVFQQTATEECRQASRADHFRDFRWSPRYHNQHWTLLLLPLLATYYRDDDGRPHLILIHGQTGRPSGRRMASMKRAQRATLIAGGLAVLLFVFSLLAALVALFLPRLAFLPILGVIGAFLVGLLALMPIVFAWRFNRSQGTQDAW